MRPTKHLSCIPAWLGCVQLVLLSNLLHGEIVINELHYNPDVASEDVEFVELLNTGAGAVDVGGWKLEGGIDYTFPAGTMIAAGGYLVICQDVPEFAAKFGFTPLGPYSGRLDNDGETVELADAGGGREDRVSYQLGFPWPTVGDEPGFSIELVHPALDNDLGGSWRASVVGGFTPSGQTLFPPDTTWKYFKPLTQAPSAGVAWREIGFDDAGWLTGQAPFFYEDGSGYGGNTVLTDMRNGYTGIYMRKTFNVSEPEGIGSLTVNANSDDGCVIWINGVEVLRQDVAFGELPYDGTAEGATGEPDMASSTVANIGLLQEGVNVVAVHAVNDSIGGSSDFLIDVTLSAQVGGATGRGPTPGTRNSVFTNNIPPQIRQVDHSPGEPGSGEVVTITARATDPDGVASVTLQYQLVDPGVYISIDDAAFETTWTSVSMNDSGTGGDVVAGDDVYTVELGGGIQTHRRLVRYRVTAADGLGHSLRVPYADDPQPNFAYFVYDGVPAWQGSIQPGAQPVVTYPASEMGRLPAYHLISKKSDVETSTWFERYRGDEYKWPGTIVYDGVVYDHVHYRSRGGVWRYSMVKNMWKVVFNRGHELRARDNWGNPYPTRWRRLNLGASIQQGDFNHRGEQGMFESVGFRLFDLAGVDAPNSTFCTFRIVDEAAEVGPNQFEGDFWGVYLALEQMDGRYLEGSGLPDGNLYKMENGTGAGNGVLNNQGPDQPGDNSDLVSFVNGYNGYSDQQWRDAMNLPKYYSYQTMAQAIHHYDICCGKNYFFYHNPETGRWETLPWDFDLTWADNMYVGGASGGTEPFRSRVLSDFSASPARPLIYREFQNRVREIRDLLFNVDQAHRLIDEYASILRGPNPVTIISADRAMWDYNPKMISATYSTDPGSKAGQGRFYQAGTPTRDFAGMVQLMKNYVVYRGQSAALSPAGGGLDGLARDTQIPAPSVVTATGPGNFPVNKLAFRAANYSGTHPFAAWRWRIAEVTPANAPLSSAESFKYEIETTWESPDITDMNALDISIPSSAVRPGRTYRVRVRSEDTTGRRSHWSPPLEFSAGEPDSATALLADLKISELMLNSPAGSEFDFVEVHNRNAATALDLGGAKFTQGIDYTFPPGTSLAPGGYLVVARTNSAAAFRTQYGLDPSVPVLGGYDGNFSNGGEAVVLRTSAGGTDIAAFTYSDGRGWPVAVDGSGHSMVPLNRAIDGQASGALSYGGNWRASHRIGGSPGAADPDPVPTVVLNEFAAHTDAAPPFESNDWIELYNTTGSDITLGAGWYLSDEGNLTNLSKWMIPPGTVIPAGGWVSFDENTGFHNPADTGFGLDKAGERLFLSFLPGTAEDRVVDAVRFKGQLNGETLGRAPDGGDYWHRLAPATRGAANVAPLMQVVISELMYHPPDVGGMDNSGDEYIELFNPGAGPVELFNASGSWRLDGGVGFEFPPGTTIPAMGYLLVVQFDPSDSTRVAAFRDRFGVSPGVLLVGPYGGQLDNAGERVAIELPQAPDLPGDVVSWVIVDEVIYADQTPWQISPDGLGPALHRQSVVEPGNHPGNWQGAAATPGGAYGGGVPPEITLQPAPASQTSAAGAVISYTVAAQGTAPLSYLWRFNGSGLPGADGDTLTLENVQPANSGAYSVVVMNPAGSALSTTVLLNVTVPPAITLHPEGTTVLPGAGVTFTVNASGSGTLSYQWRKDGLNIAGATGASHFIGNVQAADDALYTVVVADVNGSVISEAARLTVLIPPSFVITPVPQSVLAGGTATFSVQTAGTLPMGYRWRRGGATVANFVLNSHVSFLTIANVSPADAGNYSVIITNQAFYLPGYNSPVAELKVLTDSDGDGMDDQWETDNGYDPGDPADAALDVDGDGLTTRQEYDAGTDPNDPESYLRIESLVRDDEVSGGFRIEFLALARKTYTVQFRDSMALPWSRLIDVPATGADRVVEVDDEPPLLVNQRFYRLVTPGVP